MKRVSLALIALFALSANAADTTTLSKERFLDKCSGAWAGQMIGVCYGAPYEFQYNGIIQESALDPWKPERIDGAIGQDDCYVEMTFLKALEAHGLDVTYEQAGQAFAATEYPLWHANLFGRENVRRGIMPPKSGHPDFNRHADDIDFQIEADLFGILCPGMPLESNRLCDIFGHVMNYGDGVYGGMFVAGMYAAAYFEDSDVGKVVAAGLACIPEASLYHQCISDVVRWRQESPEDWRATWHKIEDKWQDDLDCMRGQAFNIDAKLNGAYIAMGLLYGNGDLEKTLEVATRCGQDNDCNPSNAAGVLCCMKGYNALGEAWTGGIAKIAKTKFSNTDYSFETLIPACQGITEAIIKRAGGEITSDAYLIPVQAPAPPAVLEQWTNEKEVLSQPISKSDMEAWNPAWRIVACGFDMEPGVHGRKYGREKVLALHPVDREKPAVIEADITVPKEGRHRLVVEATSFKEEMFRGDYLLKVIADGAELKSVLIKGGGKWETVAADLTPYAGKTIPVRVENWPTGWAWEGAYIASIRVE